MSETTTQDLCASCGHVEDDHDGYGGLCDGLGYSTSRTVCGCAEFIAFATPTSSPSGEPTRCPDCGAGVVAVTEGFQCHALCGWQSWRAAGASGGEGPEPLTPERIEHAIRHDPKAWAVWNHAKYLLGQEIDSLRRRLSEVEAERDAMLAGIAAQDAVLTDRINRAESALSTARLQLHEAKQEVEAWKSVADLAREHNRLDDISGFVARDKRRTLKARIVEAACLASSRSSGVPDGG